MDGLLRKDRNDHPAEGVTWQEANDYCLAKGQSLPTEAQWEKAARGGCELGSDPTCVILQIYVPIHGALMLPPVNLANHQLSASGLPKLYVSNTQLPSELNRWSRSLRT